MVDMSAPVVVVPTDPEPVVNIEWFPDKSEVTVDLPTPLAPTIDTKLSCLLKSGIVCASWNLAFASSMKTPWILLDSFAYNDMRKKFKMRLPKNMNKKYLTNIYFPNCCCVHLFFIYTKTQLHLWQTLWNDWLKASNTCIWSTVIRIRETGKGCPLVIIGDLNINSSFRTVIFPWITSLSSRMDDGKLLFFIYWKNIGFTSPWI